MLAKCRASNPARIRRALVRRGYIVGALSVLVSVLPGAGAFGQSTGEIVRKGAPGGYDQKVRPVGDVFPKYVRLQESGTTQSVRVGISKAVVLELPRPASDVLVSDPGVADAILRASDRAYVLGVRSGQANIFFFDAQGRQIANVDLYVQHDVSELERQLRRFLPSSRIQVDVSNGFVILAGEVATATDSQRAADLSARFISGATQSGGGGGTAGTTYAQVLNMLEVRGADQVHVKVLVAEMQREVIKQLGIDITARYNNSAGDPTFSILSNPPMVSPVTDGFSISRTPHATLPFDFDVKALERVGIIRTLAEPTLTAVSGQPAKFLAGGEFPVFTGTQTDENGVKTYSYDYKPVGVGLNFTPVVLSGGRISLSIGTEVSSFDTRGSQSVDDRVLPSIRVRRASTTVELPSGGSMVIAGLIEEQVRQTMSGLPGLRRLPIIGALFRSREYARSETELVIIVTPYLVRSVARGDLATPIDNYQEMDDGATVLTGQMNRTHKLRQLEGRYRGQIGYVYQ